MNENEYLHTYAIYKYIYIYIHFYSDDNKRDNCRLIYRIVNT